jgi:hypothetical protein
LKKDVYWFSHDANARRDQKITMMRLVYGAEGYGWFWMLVELMREAPEHKIKITGKFTLTALARELDAEPKKLEKYINDCICEFELFQTDGDFLWSPSLLARTKKYHETVDKRREAASKRWNKEDANAMQMHTTCNAKAEHEQCTSYAIRGEEILGEDRRGEQRKEEDRGVGEGEGNRLSRLSDEHLRGLVETMYADKLRLMNEQDREVIISQQVALMKRQQYVQ